MRAIDINTLPVTLPTINNSTTTEKSIVTALRLIPSRLCAARQPALGGQKERVGGGCPTTFRDGGMGTFPPSNNLTKLSTELNLYRMLTLIRRLATEQLEGENKKETKSRKDGKL